MEAPSQRRNFSRGLWAPREVHKPLEENGGKENSPPFLNPLLTLLKNIERFQPNPSRGNFSFRPVSFLPNYSPTRVKDQLIKEDTPLK